MVSPAFFRACAIPRRFASNPRTASGGIWSASAEQIAPIPIVIAFSDSGEKGTAIGFLLIAGKGANYGAAKGEAPVTIDHYTAELLAAMRQEYPGHFIVEVATPGATALIVIPNTPANRDKTIPTMPGMTVDLLDGNTITTTRREGPHEEQDAAASKR